MSDERRNPAVYPLLGLGWLLICCYTVGGQFRDAHISFFTTGVALVLLGLQLRCRG